MLWLRCFCPALPVLLLLPTTCAGKAEEADEQKPVDPKTWQSLAASSPAQVEQALRTCRGPQAVFFGHCEAEKGKCPGAGKWEGIVLEEFARAAEMFHGVACFLTVRCDVARDYCNDHNAFRRSKTVLKADSGEADTTSFILRTPAILIYPRGDGVPVQILSGRILKQEIVDALARPIEAKNRAVVVTKDNAQPLISETFKPWKFLLFSSRKSIPVILQALSDDPELWPHVRFAFVKSSETLLLSAFKVEEVPKIILQKGRDATTRQIYSGELATATLDVLRKWIKKRIEGDVDDPTEAELFQAVESGGVLHEESQPEIAQEEVSDDDEFWGPEGAKRKAAAKAKAAAKVVSHVPLAAADKYLVLKKGTQACPNFLEIQNVQECMTAITTIGYSAKPAWISQFPGLPRWCSVRDKPTADSKERMHFNSAKEGQGRSDLSPVCKTKVYAIQSYEKEGLTHAEGSENRKYNFLIAERIRNTVSDKFGGKPKSAKAQADKSTKVVEKVAIPQLNSATLAELAGRSGFLTLYLREGRLSDEEIEMLRDLEKQFRPQLKQQKTQMAFAWMDMSTERKWKAHLDPPTLPSAVVLAFGKRPRFAIVNHQEDAQGEPMPANQPALALLLNTVLGGDAKFTSLTAKALKHKRPEGFEGVAEELQVQGLEV